MSKWAGLWCGCLCFVVGPYIAAHAQDMKQTIPLPVPMAMGGTGTNLGYQAPRFTVSTLPSCGAGLEGMVAGVTDALTPAALVAVVGGGAVHVGVYCNGSAWIVL